MKKYISIIALTFAALFTLNSCNDDFLERYPETSLSSKGFFGSAENLKLYTDGLYQTLNVGYHDIASDNCVYTGSAWTLYEMMSGNVSPSSIGSWSWGNVRKANYMLCNLSDEISGSKTEVNHQIAIARFFRAYHYFDKVKTYSEVPWTEKALNVDDDDLYKTQDSREYVMGKILEDLDFAVENLKENSTKTVICKQVALAFLARVTLYEGTFRKYHSELGLNDGDDLLKKCVEACEKLMSYSYSIDSNYASIFNTGDLSAASCKSEIIMYKVYDTALGINGPTRSVFSSTFTLSRQLMEDYLNLDGSVFTDSNADVHDFYKNRDKRLAQTFWTPGYKREGDATAYIIAPNLCGYPQIKSFPTAYYEWSQQSGLDLPLFRYAEVLLSYAEAKAELGEFTQDIMDKTVNLLRVNHGGLPAAKLSDWMSNVDPVQAARYANVTGSQKEAIYEIRRERRIELACEDFRKDDLFRWELGKNLEELMDGIYVKGTGKTDGLMDVNGDSTPDICLCYDESEQTAAKSLKRKYPKLLIYNLESEAYGLTDGHSGHLYLKNRKNSFTFEVPKYYYYPLSTVDLTINPNLVQNKYWAEN